VRSRVGFVPDRPDAWPWMTAQDLMRLLAPHYATFDATRASRLLERLEVPLATPFRSMSRGEGMKAMLAAALAHDPDLLLLDEPLGGLDPLVRDEVMRCVIGAAGERPRTILMATHDLEAAARLADRVALLHEGRIVREGPVEGFVAESAHPPAEALRRALLSVAEGD
jgi:ABC-2 type transport system ATP-binding protein